MASRQNNADQELLREFLRERIGLDTESVGPYFLGTILDAALKKSGCGSVCALLEAVEQDEGLWRMLITQASINETWFLRDQRPFLLAAEEAKRRWREGGAGVLRALSSPCATGEEAYSLAIALSEAGLPAGSYQIDGIDINAASIERARAGVYGERAFRGCEAGFRSRHFTDGCEGAWTILPGYRRAVAFSVGNLLESSPESEAGSYDIVFCRNLLIYLYPEARQRLFDALKARMKEDALLVVGHAEAGIAREAGFESRGESAAFAFVWGGKTVKAPPRHSPPTVTAAAPVGKAQRLPERIRLEEIRRYADAGELRRAHEACVDYLSATPLDAAAHFLLGSICAARGERSEAEAAFRKTLYLDPQHAEARMQMAALQRSSQTQEGRPQPRAGRRGR